MPKERSLRAALDRHTGKDHAKLKQKKNEKQVDKKKRLRQKALGGDGGTAKPSTSSSNQEEEIELRKAMQTILAGADGSDSSDNGEDNEDDEEESDEGMDSLTMANLARITESDSESESEDEMDFGSGGARLDDVEDDASIALSDISSASDGEDIVPHQRLTINNTTALSKALKSISLPADWPFSESQSVTASEPTNIADVDDDLNRELAFYAQSLAAVKSAQDLLKREGILFTRPTDYFAEMVKTDEHMGKIKGKLIDEAATKKASAEAKRQRLLKKFGKQVQQEKLKERAKDKREMLDKVKLLKRKRQGAGIEGEREENLFDVALDDAATSERKPKMARRDGAQPSNTKRQKKDEKFGFGGKKRHSKSTDAKSSGDMSEYSVKKMKKPAKRLGKSRRTKTR